MSDNNTHEGIDLENVSIGFLLKNLSVGSWVWLAGLFAAVFLLGFQAPLFLNRVVPADSFQTAERKIDDLESLVSDSESTQQGLREKLSKETERVTEQANLISQLRDQSEDGTKKIADQSQQIDSFSALLEKQSKEIDTCMAKTSEYDRNVSDAQKKFRECETRLENITVDLWYIHQGEGRGYPEGNRGEVHNHDDRENWNSRRFRTESCIQQGGPRVDTSYAASICGTKKPVGPIGVLDVSGGRCGHAVFLIGCLE